MIFFAMCINLLAKGENCKHFPMHTSCGIMVAQIRNLHQKDRLERSSRLMYITNLCNQYFPSYLQKEKFAHFKKCAKFAKNGSYSFVTYIKMTGLKNPIDWCILHIYETNISKVICKTKNLRILWIAQNLRKTSCIVL